MANDPNNPSQEALDQRLRNVAHSAVDRALDAAAPAAQWLDEKTRRQQELANNAGEYVSDNPVKALVVAFVVGMVVGRLFL